MGLCKTEAFQNFCFYLASVEN